MIERIEGITTLYQREYIIAENEAYESLRANGFKPYGNHQSRDKNKKIVVFKIENEHNNDEKRDIYYFKNFQEANEILCMSL